MTALDDPYFTHRRTAAHDAFRAARDLLLDLRTDIDAARHSFVWPSPTTFNWALEWFDVIAHDNHRTALEFVQAGGGTTCVTYHELSTRSDQVANWLSSQGVQRGDRVMIVLGQQRELWETLLGCLKLGAVAIPTYTTLTASEAADRVGRGRVRHLVSRSDLTGRFAGLPLTNRVAVGEPTGGWSDYSGSLAAAQRFRPTGPTRAGDTAFAYFTSGTTSAPKLVLHTHTSYPVGHLSSLYFNALLPGDRHMNISAPGWAKHSWSSLFVPFAAEATLVVAPDGLPLADLPRLAEARGLSSLCAPPSVWAQLVPHLETAQPRLREATTAGEPLMPQVAESVRASWGVCLREGYGQTETTALAGTTPGAKTRAGKLGRALPGWDLFLREGELCVDLARGPAGMMSGYDRDPERTAAALATGSYATGDVAEIDDDGYLRIVGRSDDVFKSGGHRISPYELEAVLRSHPDVRDAAVIPVSHPTLGKAAHAVVETHQGRRPDSSALLAHVDQRVTPDLRVHSLEFTTRLPRTVTGKIRRSALRMHT
ncbi:AMP-binding protein, partial [Streptomyces sp. NRRL F-5126]|uniref:AMP-binding protein n=1 Tax=Streptomyces sp. NRRL F-5126 TaxID=1463857 RepID=UPI0004CA7C34